MAVLEPEMAILDETDSGLDIDALRIVAEGVNAMLNPDLGVLLITHYQRLLNYITPDVVHVLAHGRIDQVRRQGPGAPARGRGLRPDPARGRPRGRRGRGPRSPPRPPHDAGDRRRRTPASRSDCPGTIVPLDLVCASAPTSPSSSATSAAAPWRTWISASTSLKPRAVLDAMDGYNTRYTANVHRGIYTTGEEATAAYEKARATIARFINAPRRPRDRHGPQRHRGHQPRRVQLGPPQHPPGGHDRADRAGAPRQPRALAAARPRRRTRTWSSWPSTTTAASTSRASRSCCGTRPKLVAFTQVSNGIGTINPAKEMIAKAHEAGALVLIDGAQAVPHGPVDVQDLGADFYVFSGHKVLGPDRLRRALGAPRAARGDAARSWAAAR